MTNLIDCLAATSTRTVIIEPAIAATSTVLLSRVGVPVAVRTSNDYSLIIPRTEVHCRRCGGHPATCSATGPSRLGSAIA